MKRTTVTTYRYDAQGKITETVVTTTEEDDGGAAAPKWTPNLWPYGGGTAGGAVEGIPYTVTYNLAAAGV